MILFSGLTIESETYTLQQAAGVRNRLTLFLVGVGIRQNAKAKETESHQVIKYSHAQLS